MNKPRRQCIFCDNPVDSKEHIWPEWMHDLLGGVEGSKYNRHTITNWPDGREEIAGPTGKPGNVFNIQVRAVCQPCNNGWMSLTENEVRPFLQKMVTREPVSVNSGELNALARWCAIKFIVMEHATHETSVTPKVDRVALREQGIIPTYFRIYVANHVSKHRVGSTRHSNSLALSREGLNPPLDGTERNIQTISVLAGDLLIHLNAARVDGFDIESRFIVSRIWDECHIWPNPNTSLDWPHRPYLSDDGLRMVSQTLATLFSGPNVTRVETPW